MITDRYVFRLTHRPILFSDKRIEKQILFSSRQIDRSILSRQTDAFSDEQTQQNAFIRVTKQICWTETSCNLLSLYTHVNMESKWTFLFCLMHNQNVKTCFEMSLPFVWRNQSLLFFSSSIIHFSPPNQLLIEQIKIHMEMIRSPQSMALHADGDFQTVSWRKTFLMENSSNELGILSLAWNGIGAGNMSKGFNLLILWWMWARKWIKPPTDRDRRRA